MLEKLITLLLALLVGGGAVTQPTTTPSPSPSSSASPTASPSASPSTSPSASPTASPSPTSPSSAASPKPAEVAADACVAAVHKINETFARDHTALEHLRRESKSGRDMLAQADTLLRAIRHAATTAIHGTTACATKDEDQDEDNDEDNDKDERGGNRDNDKPATTTNVSFADVDPAAIADKAVVMMDLTLETAKKALPAETKRPEPSHKPEPLTSHGSEHGKGR